MTTARPAPNEENRGQDLSVAPLDIRCQAQIEYDDGTFERCSRFTIRPPGREREGFCIGHSHSSYARMLRSKGSKGQRAALEADAERLEELAYEMLPRVWRDWRDIRKSLWRLHRATVRRDVTVAQGKLLRALILDAKELVG